MSDLGMITRIKLPHLPQGKVQHVVIGKKYEKTLKNAAFRYNFEPIVLDDNPYVDKRLEGHADIMAAHLCNDRLIMCDFLKHSAEIDKLKALGFAIDFVPNSTRPEYPHDAMLNFCAVGDTLLYNSNIVSEDIVQKITSIRRFAKCKQGYTKCSTCVVDEFSIITEDSGVATAAKKAGLDVLLIEPAGVKLDGFQNGFIGGASFKLAHNVMAFTGYIINSNVRLQIERFLNERNIEPVYLNDCPAFDIGSVIPITEIMS